MWTERPNVGRLNICVKENVALFLCISAVALSVKSHVTCRVFICTCERKNSMNGVVVVNNVFCKYDWELISDYGQIVHESLGSQMVHICIYPLNYNCRGAKSVFQSCRLDLCVSLNTQTREQKYFNLVPMFPPVRQFVFAATQACFLSRYSSQLTEPSLLELNLSKWPLLVKLDDFNGLRFENIQRS